MPIYEYRCEGCGEVTEVFTRSMNGTEAPACPACGGTEMTRLLSAAAVTVKGGEAHAGGPMSCGRESPCCGRAERCDKPPCGH